MAADLRTSVTPLGQGLDALREPWRALEGRAARGAFALSFDWVAAWSAVYAPDEPRLVRVEEPGGEVAALGLIAGAGGRWEFAGAPVTTERGLLCAAGLEDAAWRSLGDWLRRHPREWVTLGAEGAPAGAASLPRARCEPEVVPGFDLPGSWDEYLSGRSPGSRKALKQALRRLERGGGEVVPVPEGEEPRALAAFLDLHRRRAAAKGERHPQMDERLVALLEHMTDGETAHLRLFELRLDGRTAGVTVRLDHHGTAFFYNAGMDPDAGDVSPGISLELGSIRDAIDRGLAHYDLGPGDYEYKRRLGGEPGERLTVGASSPSLRGRAAALRRDALREARRRVPVRSLARRARGRLRAG